MKDKINSKKYGKLQSIKMQLLMAFFVPVCFVILVGVTAYNKASKGIIENYKVATEKSIYMTAEYVSYGFENVKTIAVDYLTDANLTQYLKGKMADDAVGQVEFTDSEKATLISKNLSTPFISNIYLFSNDVYSLSTSANSVTGFYDTYKSTDQGKRILEGENVYHWVGESSNMDEVFGVDSESYGIRLIKRYYDTEACVVIDVDKNNLQDILSRLELGEGSMVSLISSDGVELLQTGEKKNMIYGTDFYNMAKESSYQSGYIEKVKYDNNSYMFLFAKIENADAMIGALVPTKVITAQAEDIKYWTIIIVIIASIIAVIIGIKTAMGISSSIHKVTDTLGLVAEGDLTAKLEIERKDEFAVLADHINHMIEQMKGLISNVNELGGVVSNSVQNMVSFTGQFTQSTEQIAVAIDDIEKGLTQQATDTVECVDQMNGLSTTINQVHTQTQAIQEITGETSRVIGEGFAHMEILNSKSKETTTITKDVIETMEMLQEKSKAIESIINVINGIAEQTSLLSLNASIEAARAGEAGRGFAVVADEIKKLAEGSVKATGEIRYIIDEIGSSTGTAVGKVREASEIISSQEKAVTDTTVAFNKLYKQVEYLISNLKEITMKVKGMEQQKETSIGSIESISAVTEEIVATISTVSNRTTEQSGTSTKLNGLAENMSMQIKEMEEAIHQFKI
nr:methyl-accepting chemotaxis protein [uncultured Cellulosilyticum sp.]